MIVSSTTKYVYGCRHGILHCSRKTLVRLCNTKLGRESKFYDSFPQCVAFIRQRVTFKATFPLFNAFILFSVAINRLIISKKLQKRQDRRFWLAVESYRIPCLSSYNIFDILAYIIQIM